MPTARKTTTATAREAKAITKPKHRKAKARPQPAATIIPAADVQAVVPPVVVPDALAVASTMLSGLDAAAIVLREAGAPLNAQDLVGVMLKRGLWTTAGKTPAATIHAALSREIRCKGLASRFLKAEPGRFTVAG